MQEYNPKKEEEVLAEIYRNCRLALQSIDDILPECDDGELKAEMEAQSEGYERIGEKAKAYAKNKNVELKEPNPFKKMMMWGSIKMSTLTNGSRSHVAEMMIRGTVMGITSLKTTQSESQSQDELVNKLLQELIQLEEGYERKLKTYL